MAAADIHAGLRGMGLASGEAGSEVIATRKWSSCVIPKDAAADGGGGENDDPSQGPEAVLYVARSLIILRTDSVSAAKICDISKENCGSSAISSSSSFAPSARMSAFSLAFADIP